MRAVTTLPDETRGRWLQAGQHGSSTSQPGHGNRNNPPLGICINASILPGCLLYGSQAPRPGDLDGPRAAMLLYHPCTAWIRSPGSSGHTLPQLWLGPPGTMAATQVTQAPSVLA
jgi:hypothetical protein